MNKYNIIAYVLNNGVVIYKQYAGAHSFKYLQRLLEIAINKKYIGGVNQNIEYKAAYKDMAQFKEIYSAAIAAGYAVELE